MTNSFTPTNSSQVWVSISEHHLLQNLLKLQPFCLKREILQLLFDTISIKSQFLPQKFHSKHIYSDYYLLQVSWNEREINGSHRQQPPFSPLLPFLSDLCWNGKMVKHKSYWWLYSKGTKQIPSRDQNHRDQNGSENKIIRIFFFPSSRTDEQNFAQGRACKVPPGSAE